MLVATAATGVCNYYHADGDEPDRFFFYFVVFFFTAIFLVPVKNLTDPSRDVRGRPVRGAVEYSHFFFFVLTASAAEIIRIIYTYARVLPV